MPFFETQHGNRHRLFTADRTPECDTRHCQGCYTVEDEARDKASDPVFTDAFLAALKERADR